MVHINGTYYVIPFVVKWAMETEIHGQIHATSREILCFPREGLGWEALVESLFISLLVAQASSFLICSLPLTQLASLTVLGEGSELKNWMFEQPVKK